MKEKDVYHYGNGSPGPLLQKTTTNYNSFTTPIHAGGPSIFDQPSQTIVYDGSGNRVAETDYAYDGSATQGVAGLPAGTHDETNYPSGSGIVRGNLTTKTEQCFVLPPATGSCSNTVTQYMYDETGQVVSMTDPRNNTTQYIYADNYASGTGTPSGDTNAYLTELILPSTNGVSHVEHFTYGYSDGQIRVAQDENSQNTSYAYNDPLARLTETDFPDGGKTTIAYNDAAPTPSVTKTTLITAIITLTPPLFFAKV